MYQQSSNTQLFQSAQNKDNAKSTDEIISDKPLDDTSSENDDMKGCKRNRPSNLKYHKISNVVKVNVIYSKKVLNMSFRDIAAEFNVNYNTVRNIFKVHEDGETQMRRDLSLANSP